MKKYLTNLKEGKKSIKKWRTIIKEDRDNDYDFLLVLIKKKIEFMYEYFKEKDKVSAAKMRYILELFHRLEDPFMTSMRPEFKDIVEEIFEQMSKYIMEWYV